MHWRYFLFLTLAAAHLLLVSCGAARIPILPGTVLGRVVDWYGVLSQAGNHYGYFAPSVGSPTRVNFTLSDAQGRTWTDELYRGSNPEAQLRVDTVVLNAEYPELRSRLAASWAATLLGRHPQANKVVVSIDLHYLPTMEAYRAGEMPGWEPIYVGTFERSATSSSGKEN